MVGNKFKQDMKLMVKIAQSCIIKNEELPLLYKQWAVKADYTKRRKNPIKDQKVLKQIHIENTWSR